jgi:hypothetical protein
MSNAVSRFELYDIGKKAAENGAVIDNKVAATKVNEEHFPGMFKLP